MWRAEILNTRREAKRRNFVLEDVGGRWKGDAGMPFLVLNTTQPGANQSTNAQSSIDCLEFDDTFSHLAAGSSDGRLFVYQWTDFRYDNGMDSDRIGEVGAVLSLNNLRKVDSVRWNEASKDEFVVSSSLSRSISFFSLECAGAPISNVAVDPLGCFDVAYTGMSNGKSGTGGELLCGCRKGSTLLLDRRNGRCMLTFKRSHHGNIHVLKPCGASYFLSGSSRGVVALWDIRNSIQPLREFMVGRELGASTHESVQSMDIDADDSAVVAVRLASGGCGVFDLLTGYYLYSVSHFNEGIERHDDRRAHFTTKLIGDGIILSHTQFYPIVDDFRSHMIQRWEEEDSALISTKDSPFVTSVEFDKRSLGIVCGMTGNTLQLLVRNPKIPVDEAVREEIRSRTSPFQLVEDEILPSTSTSTIEVEEHDTTSSHANDDVADHRHLISEESHYTKTRKKRRKLQRTLEEHWNREWNRLEDM